MTAEERILAVKTVADWLGKGFSKGSLHLLIEKTYDLTSYQSRNKLISEAAKSISDSLDSETLRSYIAERLDNISAKAEEAEKYSDAVKALDSYSKILGLSVDKSEVKIDTPNIKISFDD